MNTRRLIVTAGAVASIAASATAQYNFPTYNQVVPFSAAPVNTPLPVGGVTPGTYNHYSVTVNWSVAGGDPWSNEARWGFASTSPYLNGPNVAVRAADTGAAGSGAATTLTWSGFFPGSYNGGDPLSTLTRQTFSGSSANFNNIAISLSNQAMPAGPAGAIDIGTLPSGMTMGAGNLAAGQVVWYKFTLGGNALAAANTFLTIDTLGSTLTGGTFGDGNDSELGIYSESGALLATNDDINFGAGNVLSSLNFGSAPAAGPDSPVHGNLAAATFYVAVGAFNTTFGASNFNVTSTSTITGGYKVNFNTNVPTPGALALLGISGLAAARRRRS